MEAKRIILLNSYFSDQAKARLLNSLGQDFSLLGVKEIREEHYANVEILLFEGGMDWLTPERLHKMRNLKLFQNMSAGVDHIRFEWIPKQVIVCGNVGAYSPQIAEFAFGMILYFAKNLNEHYQNLSRGIFEKKKSLFLKGKTIGILGAGGIGQATAKIAKTMGMKTLGINTSGRMLTDFDSVFKFEEIDRVLRESDVVLIALPLNVKTRNLIDAQRLAKMKDSSILVNVARGAIIEEKALYNHLKNHPDFKAAIDVWWKYPKDGEKFSPDYDFFSLPNFLGTPHVAGSIPEDYQIASEVATDNIINYARNLPLKGVMEREDYLGLN